jgi:hypothetical protein
VTEDDIDRLLSALPDDWTEALLWYCPDEPTGQEPARATLAVLLVDEPPAAPAGAESYLPLMLRRAADGAPAGDRETLREALGSLIAQGHAGRLTRAVAQRRGETAP